VTSPTRAVLASGNAGKLREIRALLSGLALEVVAQSELGVGEAEESALTFIENAILKARHAAAATGLPAIADDSGIAVDALGGEPGIRSARYAGPGATDADNVAKLLAALADVPDARRGARFHCAAVYLRHPRDPVPVLAEGRWEGVVLRAPRGAGGFGYDPVFYVPGLGCSAAELAPERKNALSHRGQALRGLRARLAG